MSFIWNPVVILNLLLCVIIVILGYIGFTKNENKAVIYISLGFALFGISHAITLFLVEKNAENILIIIRILAYVLVMIGVYKVAFEK